MKHRKLRIAWSMVWGVVAALLVVLWVRSYRIWDRGYWPGRPQVQLRTEFSSDSGHVVVAIAPRMPASSDSVIVIRRPGPAPAGYQKQYADETLGFYFARGSSRWRVDIPYWSVSLFAVALAGATRFVPQRFGLRTLLIATMLIAVGLGLIVWLAR